MINQFLEYMNVAKHCSPSTLASYRRDLCRFSSYVSALGMTLTEVDGRAAAAFLESMKKLELASASIARMTSALKSFYGYLCAENIISENPVLYIKPPKVAKTFIDVLTTDEIDRLLSQPERGTFKGVRDKAMLEVLYATGIKVSELTELRISDVNLSKECITCGSCEHARTLPLGKIAAHSMAAYLEYFGSETPLPTQCFFVNINGNKLSRQGVWKILKYYTAKSGITKEITTNTLRHSFAAHLIETGLDENYVAELLGNTSSNISCIASCRVDKRLSGIFNSSSLV